MWGERNTVTRNGFPKLANESRVYTFPVAKMRYCPTEITVCATHLSRLYSHYKRKKRISNGKPFTAYKKYTLLNQQGTLVHPYGYQVELYIVDVVLPTALHQSTLRKQRTIFYNDKFQIHLK
ncbi:hypothetical protein CW304_12070 [Bacillus sp. UFRGS-B20]|nr:hypothetical protein CW304_12070 [Bacillus sp. UFRGS-B20]